MKDAASPPFPTVAAVVENWLCTSCGVCAGACPSDAITLNESPFGMVVPRIDDSQCTTCGLCVRVCPGHEFDWKGFREAIHTAPVEDAAIGPCLDIWSGCADSKFRREFQSGGFVSTVLIHALETGRIDGAAVTRLCAEDPFQAETLIARTPEEILSAVGSIYLPVPAGQILGILLQEPGRYAVVGTPCQIQGLRKAETVFPRLADRIALYVGLHCLTVLTRHFVDQAVHKMGLRRDQVARVRFRQKSNDRWFYDLRMIDKSGKVHDQPGDPSRNWPRPFFMSWRCQLCMDKLNEFSDVSCGDCRVASSYEAGPERPEQDRTDGMSDIIVRTERGRSFVDACAQAGKMMLRPSDLRAVAETTKVASKKLGFANFAAVARRFDLGVPQYGVAFEPAEASDRAVMQRLQPRSERIAVFYWRMFRLMRLRLVRWGLRRISHRWMHRFIKRREKKLSHVVLGKARLRIKEFE